MKGCIENRPGGNPSNKPVNDRDYKIVKEWNGLDVVFVCLQLILVILASQRNSESLSETVRIL